MSPLAALICAPALPSKGRKAAAANRACALLPVTSVRNAAAALQTGSVT